jgi:hypothetical protein
MYQQIVWKLASYEAHFGSALTPANKRLKLENVYYELEYRHYTEHVISKTPIVRRILNGDEFLNRHLVLLVNRISFNEY